jgi:hypothetical protein
MTFMGRGDVLCGVSLPGQSSLYTLIPSSLVVTDVIVVETARMSYVKSFKLNAQGVRIRNPGEREPDGPIIPTLFKGMTVSTVSFAEEPSAATLRIERSQYNGQQPKIAGAISFQDVIPPSCSEALCYFWLIRALIFIALTKRNPGDSESYMMLLRSIVDRVRPRLMEKFPHEDLFTGGVHMWELNFDHMMQSTCTATVGRTLLASALQKLTATVFLDSSPFAYRKEDKSGTSEIVPLWKISGDFDFVKSDEKNSKIHVKVDGGAEVTIEDFGAFRARAGKNANNSTSINQGTVRGYVINMTFPMFTAFAQTSLFKIAEVRITAPPAIAQRGSVLDETISMLGGGVHADDDIDLDMVDEPNAAAGGSEAVTRPSAGRGTRITGSRSSLVPVGAAVEQSSQEQEAQ